MRLPHQDLLDFGRLAELLGRPLPEDFVPNYRERTFAALEAELKSVPGIEAALDQIEIPYCIASNGPHAKMRKTLGVTSLLRRFEGRMFSSADVPRGKPYPDLFLHAARHFAVAPAACLVVEDSVSGIAAALAAGMFVYGGLDSFRNPESKTPRAEKVAPQVADAVGGGFVLVVHDLLPPETLGPAKFVVEGSVAITLVTLALGLAAMRSSGATAALIVFLLAADGWWDWLHGFSAQGIARNDALYRYWGGTTVGYRHGTSQYPVANVRFHGQIGPVGVVSGRSCV